MPILSAELAAEAFQAFAPMLASWAQQAIEGGKLTPEEAAALWSKATSDWDNAFAAWTAASPK